MKTYGLVVLVALSGCQMTRTLVMPPPLSGAPTLETEHTWRLGEFSVQASAFNQGTLAQPNVDLEPLKQQLRDRLRSTLEAQGPLGWVSEGARYNLELEVSAKETYGIGPGMGAGLLVEAGVLVLGAVVGGLVGARADANSQSGVGGALGMSIGMGVAAPVALASAFAFNLAQVRGEYAANLTLRRRADRIPVATRKVTSPWVKDYNGYGAMSAIERGSGEAVPDFERALLEAIKSMLLELNEPVVSAQ